MSNFIGSRYDKEEVQVLLSKKDPDESPQHKHYLWMAHWTKASSSAGPQNNNISNPLEDINKGSTAKGSETLPYEFMKSTVAERLMVGVSHGSTSMQHAEQFNSSMWGVAQHVCNELRAKNNEQVDGSFEKSMKKNAPNLRARAVVSETYSVHKLSEFPSDFQKHGSSEDPNSDWSHFPMFEINRKIDNILNPKRRSVLGPATLSLNMSASHVMALSSQEYRMNSHQIADENMKMCQPAGGFASRAEDPADLNSDPSGQKLKRKLLDTMSCSCSKDDNSSDCEIDEQHTSHHLAKAKHVLSCASDEKKFTFAANNKNRIVASVFHNMNTRRSAAHKQENDAEIMFRTPVPSRERQNEAITMSNKSKKDDENFHETHISHGKAVSSSLLPYEQQHLKTQRAEAAANLKGSILPDQIANKLTEKSKSSGDLLTHGPKSNEIYTGKSSGFGVCMYGTNIGSQLFGAQNQSSAKTETFYSDTLIRSKSSAGIASLSAQKDCVCPNEAKSEQLANHSERGDSRYSKDDGFHNVNGNHDVSSKATIASKQSCMPGTRITNLDLILSQMSRMRNQICSGIVQPPIGAEPSDRWLKRLQLDISEPNIRGSKRPKILGSPPLGQTNSMFDITVPCNKIDTGMIGAAEDKSSNEGNNELQDKQERSPVPAKSMNSWIGRWCQGGNPVFHEDSGKGRQATKPDQPAEELEGQFPSIAAMAMMGRVMNKLRPCEHQKKGPFVVWKTD
ncbi:hypothetical protein HU200_026564 [Digitaria exilis]|uniref:F-box protein n=1 Tax=Digitaria exilis TaxID=1010633 RepID=A0A835BYE9_9POAL|nr:hypothetical protein HU200_026564 [Digitaria exilis]